MEAVAQIINAVLAPIKCADCGSDFVRQPGPLAKYIIRCPACLEANNKKLNAESDARLIADAAENREKQWAAICPALFQDTVIEKLPCQAAFQEMTQWKYGATGLVLHGPSGMGKSRCAWLLMEREYKSGRNFKVLDSMAGLKYAAKFAEGSDKVESWIEGFIKADLLFMDDIFKNKLTDSFEGAIFTLIDQRIQQMRPTITTSNDTGKTLAARMTEDRAEPLIRRMREHSQTIIFKK